MQAMYAEDGVFLYTLRPEDEKIIRAQLVPDVAAALFVAESSASQAP